MTQNITNNTYAIGDLHGCYDQLQQLLDKIKFDPSRDTLWFTGDLINGGPKPVETLRFIKSLKANSICVLGNHDLTLLGIAAGKITELHDRPYGFNAVLTASDRDELLDWLRHRPMLHYDADFDTVLVHAGILPTWSVMQAQQYAHEVEAVLRSDNIDQFLAAMYGNVPETWNEDLKSWDRIRFIINAFTRIRFCDAAGRLELTAKGESKAAPPDFLPWFNIPNPSLSNTKVIFGHWAALMGETGMPFAQAIDTGCMWGHSLTALRLNDWQRFGVRAV